MADTNKAARQQVKQEATEKLIRTDRHFAFLVAVRVVLPAKRYRVVLKCNQSVIRDGNSMCIAGEILQDMPSTSERVLCVHDPVLSE